MRQNVNETNSCTVSSKSQHHFDEIKIVEIRRNFSFEVSGGLRHDQRKDW